MQEGFNTKITGEVKILDTLTGEVLIEKKNAIHPQNMATALARGLSNSPNGQIFKLKLGNQGTYIDSSQQIVFRPPNTTGVSADLYNPTYVEVVDDSDSIVGVGNSVTFTNIPNTNNTRVIVTCVVEANEAVNRPTDESNTGSSNNGNQEVDPDGTYFFDELGLFTGGLGTPDLLNEANELMLSHLVFSPIESTGNRSISIVYSLTLQVS